MNTRTYSSRLTSEVLNRAICLQCLKSQVTCYCGEIKKFKTKFKIILLQHPMERRKAIGTARMTHLAIENSTLIVGKDFNDNPQVNALLRNPELYCVVLFPGPQSLNLSLLPQHERTTWFPTEKQLVILVIDGTWASAKRMLRQSPNLLELPQICFTPQRPSEYKIRQQPKEHCVSSIEAVHQLLEILEPATRADHLLELFRGMVELQIRCFEHHHANAASARVP